MEINIEITATTVSVIAAMISFVSMCCAIRNANISKKNTYEIAETIYLSVVETMPKLYKNLIYKDLDEVELIKKLITLNEDFIENLKQFFSKPFH